MLVLGLLIIGVLARFVPHAPNFTPVVAIALFGGVYFRRSMAIWMPLALMVLSDMVLGFHNTIGFTWGSVILVSLMGIGMRRSVTPLNLFGQGIMAAVVFFVVTNFGCWLTMYPRNLAGLTECFSLALPFFRAMLVSTLFYVAVLFGVYAFIVNRIRGTRLEAVLLYKQNKESGF